MKKNIYEGLSVSKPRIALAFVRSTLLILTMISLAVIANRIIITEDSIINIAVTISLVFIALEVIAFIVQKISNKRDIKRCFMAVMENRRMHLTVDIFRRMSLVFFIVFIIVCINNKSVVYVFNDNLTEDIFITMSSFMWRWATLS